MTIIGHQALGSRLSTLHARAESREPTAESTRNASPAPDKAERLRGVARQLEGVFVEQLFKAMRETVPEGGAMSGGSGEAMFSGMLDQHLAGQAPARWSNGLAEAVYRQLQVAAGVDGSYAGASADDAAEIAGAAPSSPASGLPILDSASSPSAASPEFP